MKGFNFWLLVAGLALVSIVINCGDVDVAPEFSSTEQFKKDSLVMRQYILDHGYESVPLDTTASRVIFAIVEEGDSTDLQYDDIVSYHFVLRRSDDTVIDTSIDTLALHWDIYDSVNLDSYKPYVFTLAKSAWTVPEYFRSETQDQAYKNAAAKAIARMNLGGKAALIFPSESYYISREGFENVYIFEIYPVEVRKANR